MSPISQPARAMCIHARCSRRYRRRSRRTPDSWALAGVTTEGKLVYSLPGKPVADPADDPSTDARLRRAHHPRQVTERTPGWVLTETLFDATARTLAPPAGAGRAASAGPAPAHPSAGTPPWPPGNRVGVRGMAPEIGSSASRARASSSGGGENALELQKWGANWLPAKGGAIWPDKVYTIVGSTTRKGTP